MIDTLNNVPSYEVWVRAQLVKTVEEAFRSALNIDSAAPINYFINACIPGPDGKCQEKHKVIWCGGMTLPQFIKKALKMKHFYALFATSHTCKSAWEKERYYTEEDWEEKGRCSYWICDVLGQDDHRLICCDEMWQWLFYHIKDKKAK